MKFISIVIIISMIFLNVIKANTPKRSSEYINKLAKPTAPKGKEINIKKKSETTFNIPESFLVKQNYPNPFNSMTTIEYELASESGVYIVIYNSLGRIVQTLVNEIKAPGRYSLKWDGKDQYGQNVSSGVYFYVVRADENYSINKMVLLK